LQRVRYHVIPVNPAHSHLLDSKCFPDLKSIERPVDIVNIFRNQNYVIPIVEDAITTGARVVWMQSGIVNEKAARLALDNGLKVVMSKCIKIEHLYCCR